MNKLQRKFIIIKIPHVVCLLLQCSIKNQQLEESPMVDYVVALANDDFDVDAVMPFM